MTTAAGVGSSEFTPPGPGRWERDISHTTKSPTRLFRRLAETTMPAAYREVFARFGAPAETLDVRFVHGAMYRRIVPLVGAQSNRPPPPRPILWLALRLHPAFRRRERAARAAWTERPERHVVEGWHRAERGDWVERNQAIQAVELPTLSDVELAAEVRRTDEHLFAGWTRHHILHGSDIGPIGDLLVHARGWGLDAGEVLVLLRGSSTASSAGADHARRIADALRAGDVDPATIDDLDVVRSVPDAREHLDAYLAEAAWQVVTFYDIDALTVGEMPDATCALIRSQANADSSGSDVANTIAARVAELRARVPDGQRDLFDELLAHARRAYGMRDDNGPVTAEWPAGLLRRAFLEAGRRLAASGRLQSASHVFELESAEVAGALEGDPAPSADVAVARAEERAREAKLVAPAVLGPDDPPPDLSVMPAAMRRTMDVVVTAISLLEVDPAAERAELHGTGIGDRVHRGVARVADDVDELIEQMQPDDVLVAPWTAPTYNALFAIAGAVVVAEGGLLCHAAVMARELGIPTVIGCRGAMTELRSGDLIEVDPLAGQVRVLERA